MKTHTETAKHKAAREDYKAVKKASRESEKAALENYKAVCKTAWEKYEATDKAARSRPGRRGADSR